MFCSSCYQIGFIMTTLFIISTYVLSVFLNRWLNKVTYKKQDCEILPIIWFIPILPAMVFIYVLFLENLFSKDNWFNGSRW